MNEVKTGGAAFQRAGFYPDTSNVAPDDLHRAIDTITEPTAGMSLRDWYAGQALAGFLAAHADENVSLPDSRRTAGCCWRYADAMLEQRDQPSTLKPLPPVHEEYDGREVPPIPPMPNPFDDSLPSLPTDYDLPEPPR